MAIQFNIIVMKILNYELLNLFLIFIFKQKKEKNGFRSSWEFVLLILLFLKLY